MRAPVATAADAGIINHPPLVTTKRVATVYLPTMGAWTLWRAVHYYIRNAGG